MLKFYNYDIVFQEIPDEVTLAINITGCPYRCIGCHSPHLRESIGELLTEEMIESHLSRYRERITCVCFMGGDADPAEVERLAGYISSKNIGMKIGWYSGRSELPSGFSLNSFSYIKLGEYREDLGGLSDRKTNQRLYRIDKALVMNDITFNFYHLQLP